MENPPDPEELEKTVLDLKSRIQRHRAYLQGSELRTRQVLIDPLLRALGWDVEIPDEVQLEFTGTGGRLDYVLMLAGSPVALIEAKRLGSQLEDAVDQLISYKMDPKSVGVGLVAWTNGNEWVFWQTPARRRREAVQISASDSFKTAYRLANWLARSNLRERGRVSAVHDSPIEGNWYPLSGRLPRDRQPTGIRFEGGTVMQLRYWYDLYVAVARHLLESGALTSAKIPVASPSGSRYLVSNSPKHPDGRAFWKGREFAAGLWIDADKWIPWKSAKLIEAVGGDPATVQVRFDYSSCAMTRDRH